jgi:hypothetical protein
LCFFKQLFGFGKAKEVEDDYRGIFECEVGRRTFKYLVVPIYYRKFLNKKWKLVEDLFERKLAPGLGKMLSN